MIWKELVGGFAMGMNGKCGRRSGSMGFKESDMHEGL